MADGMALLARNEAEDILARLVGEFAALSDRALNGIVQGAPAGYLTPSLATAILDGRQMLGLRGPARHN